MVITGTSSGLGKATTKALLRSGDYHVIGAVRDLEPPGHSRGFRDAPRKMKVVADLEAFDMERFTPMWPCKRGLKETFSMQRYLDLASFESVKDFAKELDKFRGDRPIDRLVCNAAVYQPTLSYPKWTVDGHEQPIGPS